MRNICRILVVLAFLSFFQSASCATVHNAEVLWDEWGVPHIFSHDDPSAFRAFGWAQMHNHAAILLHLYALARGRGAEYFGPGDLDSDRMVRTMGTPLLARQWYAQQSKAFQEDLDAFAAGINLYGQDHAKELDDAARKVLPVYGTDVLAHVARVLWLFQGGTSGCTGAMASASYGSNGWAITASHSASGHALLLANPHLPWEREMLFFEAHITTSTYEAYGATLVGFPVPAIAFNNNLGWTHTVNLIDTCDLYILTQDGDGYRFDGKTLNFEVSSETIKIRQADGTLKDQQLTIRRAVQGPVISHQGKLVAVRDAGLQSASFAGVLEQWWQMGRAHNLAEFQTALRRMQLPMFNTIYADRSGNAFFAYSGLVPKRNDGDFKYWSLPVPGDTSHTLWTGVLDYDSLPNMLDPQVGWVQNSNSAPWYVTQPMLDPA